MRLPKMILFDYGQTLINEQSFDGVRGTSEVLKYATKNKYNHTAKEVQDVADALLRETGRFDPLKRHELKIEIPNHMFTAYLYQSMGIELSLSPNEIDRVFWNAAAPGIPTEGIREFLAFLREQGVRTGVISNIAYAGEVVEERITTMFPEHTFELILATSEYMYRKPDRRIFELALEKADLRPDEVWYIGDQYECDVVGAKNAGIFPLWYIGAIDLPDQAKEDVLTVKSWAELKEIMLN